MDDRSRAPLADTTESGESPVSSFSEKEFYLSEFRGRALGLALDGACTGPGGATLEAVLRDLDANRTRSVLLATDAEQLAPFVGDAIVQVKQTGWVGEVWHALRGASRVGLLVDSASELAAAARSTALRLRLAKLVWLSAEGPIQRSGGGRLSYLDLDALTKWLEDFAQDARAGLLAELRTLVEGGLPSAAICRPEDLDKELFTYSGAGTFLTRDRYIDIRALGLDELDAAHDLLQRGVEEGFLVARSEEQLEVILTNAFGVFVEGRYLAGIGALVPHPSERAGEIASLYALTRFSGGAVGGRLLDYAVEHAGRERFNYLYACTTQARVVSLFEASGFRQVEPNEIPAEKWQDYPEERRAVVRCLRRDL